MLAIKARSIHIHLTNTTLTDGHASLPERDAAWLPRPNCSRRPGEQIPLAGRLPHHPDARPPLMGSGRHTGWPLLCDGKAPLRRSSSRRRLWHVVRTLFLYRLPLPRLWHRRQIGFRIRNIPPIPSFERLFPFAREIPMAVSMLLLPASQATRCPDANLRTVSGIRSGDSETSWYPERIRTEEAINVPN